MGQRYGFCTLGVLAILIGGCNKKDGPAPNAASSGDPVQMNISGQQPAVLSADNIQAEIDKAGASVKLVKLDLSPVGLPLTMDAPEGAKAHNENQDVQVNAGDSFAIRFKLGQRSLKWRKRNLTGQKVLINTNDLVVYESALLLAARCEFSKHVVVGYRDYCVENIDPVFGRQCNHSEADCLLMLKCIATLVPKTPLPAEPLAALRQLNAQTGKGSAGAANLTLDPHQTTDAALELVGKLQGIERLDLHRCPITDDGLAHLKGLNGLKELNLSDCDFTDAGLSSLGSLTNLRLLNLASSFGDSPQIKGPGLSALAGLNQLQVLVLDKNLIDDAGLAHLRNLKGLKELYLEQTARVKGPGLANLADLPNLTLLSLSETRLGDDTLEHLKMVSHLEVLNLHGTLLKGPGLKHLYEMKNLHTLNLGNTLMSDVELPKLAGLPALKRLILEGADVSDSGLEYLQAIKTLKQVTLSGTKVTTAGAAKLKAALPGLEVTLE